MEVPIRALMCELAQGIASATFTLSRAAASPGMRFASEKWSDDRLDQGLGSLLLAHYRPMSAHLLAAFPNALALTRLILGVVFAWVPVGGRAAVVLAAVATDVLDGASSRRLHATSALGRIMDPVADKVFVFAVLATLLLESRLEVWEAALVGLRDLVVLVGAGWLLVRKGWPASPCFPPTLLGKLTTGVQFLFLLALLIWPEWTGVVLLPTASLSGLTAAQYARRFLTEPRANSTEAVEGSKSGGIPQRQSV
jgi:phosphatidylglycerophosphate synthase